MQKRCPELRGATKLARKFRAMVRQRGEAAWDAWLSQACGPVTSTYDGDGRRHSRQTPSQTRQFIYDFEKILQETDGTGTTQQQYASTEEQFGDLISAYGGGNSRYFANDALGSTAALLAPDGSVPDAYAYRAFGLATQTAGTIADNRYDWVGKQGYYDDLETGLYLLRARHYDPAVARFLSQDPDGFGAGDANLYRYVNNDPVNHTDPSGKALLVSPCDFEVANIRYPVSAPSNRLGEQLEYAYPNRVKRPLHVGDYVKVKGRNYGQVNLYEGLDAKVWGWLSEGEPGPGGYYSLAGQLGPLIGASLEGDRVISLGQPDGLIWSEPEATLWYRVTGSLYVLANYVYQAGARIFGALGAAGAKVLEGVQALIDVGFAALAQLTSVSAQDFLDKLAQIAKLVDSIGKIVTAIVQQPEKFANNFLKGIQQGFDTFFDPKTFFARLQEQLFTWLFGLADSFTGIIEKLPMSFDVSSLFQFVLDVVGLSVDALKQTAVDAVTEAYGIAISIADIEGYLEQFQDIVAYFFDAAGHLDLSGGAVKLAEAFSDLIRPQELWDSFVKTIKEWVTNTAVKKLVEWVATLFVPAAAAFKIVYDGIVWIATNIDLISDLFKKFFGLLDQALKDNGPAAVAAKVVELLATGVSALFSVLAKLLNVDTIKTVINTLLVSLTLTVRNWIKKAIKKLLGKETAGCDTKAKPKGASVAANAAVKDKDKANDSCNYCAEKNFVYVTTSGAKSWAAFVAKCPGDKKAGPQVNVHGHHIVMKGKFKDLLRPVQNILCKHDIDPFKGCDNLVIARNWCHTEKYAMRTVKLITEGNKKGKTGVLLALKQLADEFVKCDFGDTDSDKLKTVDPMTDE